MPKTKQDILREFDRTFGINQPPLSSSKVLCESDKVKSFLSTSLDQMAGELVGAVKEQESKLKFGQHTVRLPEIYGWNSARSDLLAKCKEMGLEVGV